ncbi:MAG: sugar phosphate isomerase/epimerase [Eubacteriales bacterium]|nr:sugar phosphate isomerase/epimerase [Eubacteriales bacterium]
MKIGFIIHEIRRRTIGESFFAARGYGLEQAQFNFTSFCGTDMPEKIPDDIVRETVSASREYGVEIVAINGTFNMIGKDRGRLSEDIRRFELIAETGVRMGCKLITLCTGTRSGKSMWSWHPDTISQVSWDELTDTIGKVLVIAEKYDMLLGIEPEYTNVVNTADRALRLIETMGGRRLRIIMDCANLFHPGEAKKENVRGVIGQAFDLLGDFVAAAHGKDILESDGIKFTYAGNGIIDFDYFLDRLDMCGYKGGMILHGTHSEAEMAAAASFIRKKLEGREK